MPRKSNRQPTKTFDVTLPQRAYGVLSWLAKNSVDGATENVLAALRKNPRISTWDMSENGWLRDCIRSLQADGKIREAEDEAYPWHRYKIVEPPTDQSPTASETAK